MSIVVSPKAPTAPAPLPLPVRQAVAELPLLACWLNVVVAAFAQTATIPGRVYGLGPITEPLLKDFGLSRTTYGLINFWATVVTAVLCFSFGTILTRLGTRRTHFLTMLGLGGATALLTVVSGTWMLFMAITLARVIGQGMLALVSTSMVGKSFPRRIVLVMAVYSIVTAFLFGIGVQLLKWGLDPNGLHLTWRGVWLILAAVLVFGLTPFGYFAMSEPRVPQYPESSPIEELPPRAFANNNGSLSNGDSRLVPAQHSELQQARAASLTYQAANLLAPLKKLATKPSRQADPERTLWQAMHSPVFILFGLSCLVTGMANAGIALFNESVFKDRGLPKEVFFDSLTIGVIGALGFKVVGAWLCDRWSMRMMSGLCMVLYATTSLATPFLETPNQAYVWSIGKAVALSIHTVIYYAIWSYAFGRRDLAQIQGAAHVLTVTASGLGPWIFGYCRDQLGTYDPCMYFTAAASFAIGVGMLFFRVPCAERPREDTVTPEQPLQPQGATT